MSGFERTDMVLLCWRLSNHFPEQVNRIFEECKDNHKVVVEKEEDDSEHFENFHSNA